MCLFEEASSHILFVYIVESVENAFSTKIRKWKLGKHRLKKKEKQLERAKRSKESPGAHHERRNEPNIVAAQKITTIIIRLHKVTQDS